MSGELWLAEGFTQYYGPLTMVRAGLLGLDAFVQEMSGLVASIASNPARLVRSAEEMSQMAVFTDMGAASDRTNWSQTVISYYDFGGAIALALDLTLRERTAGRATLDDFMKAMWRAHGAPGGTREGFVDRPYSMADAEARLAEVAGDAVFARDFFARFIQGRELADYAMLLQGAGIRLRKSAPGRAWLGDVRFEDRSGTVRLASAPPFGSPDLRRRDRRRRRDPAVRWNADSIVRRRDGRRRPAAARRQGADGVCRPQRPTADRDDHIGRGSGVRARSHRTRRRRADGCAAHIPGTVGELMAFPWLRLLDAALGMTDIARRVKAPPSELAPGTAAPLEARLAGVVVAALKEAFDRDTRRLELERDQIEAERKRAEQALRLELRRQTGEREIGRLRLVAAIAVTSWLATLFFSRELLQGGAATRAALGIGWVLLLGALGSAFTAQSTVADRIGGDGDLSSGPAGAIAPWLIVVGLAVIGLAVLVSGT